MPHSSRPETTNSDDITELLLAWSDGDQSSLERLIPLVRAELHRLAHYYMRGERDGHILQTTALVNEAYLKLVDASRVRWQNRAHFFAVSAQLMRRVLIDFARSRDYQKRGGGALHIPLDDALGLADETNADIIALDLALSALSALDARKARVVELRFFGGLDVKETAEVLGVSVETVMRDWKMAKVWLMRELSAGGGGGGS